MSLSRQTPAPSCATVAAVKALESFSSWTRRWRLVSNTGIHLLGEHLLIRALHLSTGVILQLEKHRRLLEQPPGSSCLVVVYIYRLQTPTDLSYTADKNESTGNILQLLVAGQNARRCGVWECDPLEFSCSAALPRQTSALSVATVASVKAVWNSAPGSSHCLLDTCWMLLECQVWASKYFISH